ncbi:hypothetical protein JXA47_08060 [Candidatus Sumerlaeota bacterium]|nr:hypothetical protein [Candidatus Sumerlaeota bacterium]
MLEPFRIHDCALIVRMGGVPDAMNLRELRDRVVTCPPECLYHHFCETLLRATFDDPEFRNDFAVWASRALHDRALAEQLGVIDPYTFDDREALRAEVLDIIADRLHELPMVPWAKRGEEFNFMRAVTVVFDTGHDITEPSDLPGAIERMTRSSLYYHFVEARRRTDGGTDDFSTWLSAGDGEAKALIQALQSVDFYFLTLGELKTKLIQVTRRALNKGGQR